jgi:hypothetical protein
MERGFSFTTHSDDGRTWHSILRESFSISCHGFNGASFFSEDPSEVKFQVHFTRDQLYDTRDYESRGKAPSSMTPRGTSPGSWRPLKEDIRRKPGKNVGIPQVGDAGDRAAHNATIATDHLSRILRGFQWGELRMGARILRELGPGFQWGSSVSFDYLGAQSETIEIRQGRKGTKRSRAQSFDYLGAVFENFSDRVCLTSVSLSYSRNLSGILVLIVKLLETIPPVAGRGPCLAPDFASGLHDVPRPDSIPWPFNESSLFEIPFSDPRSEDPCSPVGKSGGTKDSAATQSFVPRSPKVSRLHLVLSTVGETAGTSVCPQNGPMRCSGPSVADSPPQTECRRAEPRNLGS